MDYHVRIEIYANISSVLALGTYKQSCDNDTCFLIFEQICFSYGSGLYSVKSFMLLIA